MVNKVLLKARAGAIRMPTSPKDHKAFRCPADRAEAIAYVREFLDRGTGDCAVMLSVMATHLSSPEARPLLETVLSILDTDEGRPGPETLRRQHTQTVKQPRHVHPHVSPTSCSSITPFDEPPANLNVYNPDDIGD